MIQYGISITYLVSYLYFLFTIKVFLIHPIIAFLNIFDTGDPVYNVEIEETTSIAQSSSALVFSCNKQQTAETNKDDIARWIQELNETS